MITFQGSAGATFLGIRALGGMVYNGYRIYPPVSGGKAGKGRNVTTSLQVRSIVKLSGYEQILKNISYKTGDRAAYLTALEKAKKFIDDHRHNRELPSQESAN